MYYFDLGNFGKIEPNVKLAMAMTYKHKENLESQSISQEIYDKYQTPASNVLKYANISLDIGGDSQQ